MKIVLQRLSLRRLEEKLVRFPGNCILFLVPLYSIRLGNILLSELEVNELQTVVFVGSVPPSLSAWLETGGGQTVAVCRAERGKPAATISWSQTGPTRDTSLEHDGFVTVESRLELLQGSDLENLTCVINHTYWAHQQFRLPQLKKGDIPETSGFFSLVLYLVFNSWV